MKNKTPIILILIIFVTVAAAFFIIPSLWGNSALPWRLGLDLIGGTQLTYEVDLSAVSAVDRDELMSGLRDVMEKRINYFGVSEPQVITAKSGDSYRLVVELAGIKNATSAIKQIGRTAHLEFKEVVVSEESKESKEGEEFKESYEYIKTDLTGRYLKRAQVVTNSTTYKSEIDIEFDSEGAKIFEELTGRNIEKPLAIFLDDNLISAPIVRDKIVGGKAVITGQFTLQEAKNLANLLNAGALPAPIKLVSQQTIGASLGINSLIKTIFAALIGALVVVFFMVVYYRRCLLGLFSALALVIYIILTLAIFKVISMTMSLAGIAGFILSIGMAVDANILIFERTKEEIKKGLSKISAIEEGFRRAWFSIRDSNISTIITSIILYYFTTSFVRGFALALLIGVLVSMFSAITITRTLLRTFVKN